MSYNADMLKKQYQKEYSDRCKENLIKLREEIAKLSSTEFCKQTGIQKSNLSSLENGDREPSMFIIRAYKTYFLEKHNLNISTDYLLGYTSVIENKKMNISDDLGLSGESIEMLKMWKEQRDNQNKIIPALGNDLNIINLLLEYQYRKAQKVYPNYPSWSVFHFIGQYLTPHKMKREQQDRLRVCDGAEWKDIEIGDTLEKAGGDRYCIKKTDAVNSKTFSGSDTSKLHIVSDDNNEHYVIDVDTMFKSYSKDNIFSELDKIKDYIAKRK